MGEQPSTPPEQVAFRCILKRDDAPDVLGALFDAVTPSGTLYAAAGLALANIQAKSQSDVCVTQQEFEPPAHVRFK